MLTIVRRVIGWGAIAIALVILGYDLFAYERGGAFNAHSIRQDWQVYSMATYVNFKGWLGHVLPTKLAGYTEIALSLWTWAALALAGIFIAPSRRAD